MIRGWQTLFSDVFHLWDRQKRHGDAPARARILCSGLAGFRFTPAYRLSKRGRLWMYEWSTASGKSLVHPAAHHARPAPPSLRSQSASRGTEMGDGEWTDTGNSLWPSFEDGGTPARAATEGSVGRQGALAYNRAGDPRERPSVSEGPGARVHLPRGAVLPQELC